MTSDYNESDEALTEANERVDTLVLERCPGETDAQTIARYFTSAGANAGLTIQRASHNLLPLELTPLINDLARQSKSVNDRDLSGGQTMLTQQAATLDALFHKLVRFGLQNMQEGYSEAAERYMRLGFKAQAQCRSNWEAINEIQNPGTVAFVKQANIAAGHQQVNNARGESEYPPNELNEAGNEQPMDTRGTAPAIGANQALAAVGAINRAANARGKATD